MSNSIDNSISLDKNAAEALKAKTIALGDLSSSSGAITMNSSAAATELDKQYASTSGARLVNFKYNSGTEDATNRAYFKLEGTGINDLKESLPSENNSCLTAIIDEFTGNAGFKSFVLLSINESRQEKQSVVTTIGDYFATTFSGKEPQVIELIGLLPFDNSKSSSSWYINYINAYKFLFRASILAKYKLKLKLCLNNFVTYTCYPVAFSSNIQANQDNVIHFSMSLIVAEDVIQKVYGISTSAKNTSSPADGVKSDVEKSSNAQATGTTLSPSEVGTASSKKNFLDTVSEFIDGCLTGNTTNELAKGINTVNRVLGGIDVVTGAINTITGGKVGRRTSLKLF